jgi:hypothetical protein
MVLVEGSEILNHVEGALVSAGRARWLYNSFPDTATGGKFGLWLVPFHGSTANQNGRVLAEAKLGASWVIPICAGATSAIVVECAVGEYLG